MAASVAQAQMVGMPLVSTSVGGVVSGTYGYFRNISATSIAAPGTWCGLRQVYGYCINASTPRYTGANIACNGNTLAASCTYYPDIDVYVHTNPTNCPSGYTGILVSGGYVPSVGSSVASLTCVKN
ncbi:MAG TPA: hypothetical protein VHP58_03710 [Alphaproteobacteria bacterium]|nr:hypothetical protein [Alphaproteobacteria bacterium]